MTQPPIRLSWTVAETLTQCPASAGVFGRFRMACVGCVMAPFETLSEAAEAYGIDPQNFLGCLREASPAGPGRDRPQETDPA